MSIITTSIIRCWYSSRDIVSEYMRFLEKIIISSAKYTWVLTGHSECYNYSVCKWSMWRLKLIHSDIKSHSKQIHGLLQEFTPYNTHCNCICVAVKALVWAWLSLVCTICTNYHLNLKIQHSLDMSTQLAGTRFSITINYMCKQVHHNCLTL